MRDAPNDGTSGCVSYDEVRIVVVHPEEELLVAVRVDERDRVVGDLARRRAARLHRPVDGDVQRRALGVVLVHAALEAAAIGEREVVEAEQAAGEVAGVVQRLRGGAHVGPEPRPPDRLVPGDRGRPAAGGDRRHRVARRRRVRPAVLEQRPFRGQRVDHRRRRARVAVAAEVVGAQRVDGDQQQVEVGGTVAGRSTMRAGGGSASVASSPSQSASTPSPGRSSAPG